MENENEDNANEENEAPNQMPPGMPPPPHPYEAMWQAYIWLGLTPIAAQEFNNNDINTIEWLSWLSSDDINCLIKQIHWDNMNGLFIPFGAQQAIHAIRFWANRKYILGQPYNAELITAALAAEWDDRRRIEAEAPKASDIVKAPEVFKKETQWKSWKESLQKYLNTHVGQASIPVSYIIRNDLPVEEQIYATTHDELVNNAILFEPEFNVNMVLCMIFYNLLHSMVQLGHGSILTHAPEMEELLGKP
jgi:hypothetical protein